MLATCDRINKGTGESLLHKLEVVGAPLTKGGRVAQAVQQLQQEWQYNRGYRKRAEVKKRRLQGKFRQRRDHHRAKMARKAGKNNRGDYVKGQLDPHVDHAALKRQAAEQKRRLRQAKQESKQLKNTHDRTPRDHTYAYNFRARTDHTYSQ